MMNVMQKTSLPIVLFSTAFVAVMATPTSVQAFQATLDTGKVLHVVHGQVLGESDTRGSLPPAATQKTVKPVMNTVRTTAQEAVPMRGNELKLSVEEGHGKLTVQPRSASRSGQQPVGQFEDKYMRVEIPRPSGATGAGDKVTIQTPPREMNPSNLEIEAGGMRAPIPRGSEVTIDPNTNSISITNQNGNIHELNNLPDQAFEKIRERLTVDPAKYDDIRSNLVMTNNDDGSITYTTEVTEQRKAFGILPFEVKTEYQVDDQTGLVTTTEKPATSFWGRLLQRFGQ